MNDYSAIIWGTRTIHHSRLEQYISSIIKHLKGRGIAAGDRVAIIDTNTIEYVIVLLAFWRMGVVACPLNPKLPHETLLQSLSSLNPKLVLSSHKEFLIYKKTKMPVAELKELISFDARSILEAGHAQPVLDQEATIIWTSGSSGQAKAVVHTWGNHYYSALGSQEQIPLQMGDRWVLSLPLFHVSGISIVCRCFLAQATIVISTDADVMDVIRKNKPTHISLVSTQFYRLMEDKDNHPFLRNLKYILLGGSAIPAALLEKALYLDLPVYTSYGMTETSSQVATGKVENINKPCAKVLKYRQLKIDEKGQICVKGEVLFKGYLAQNRVTRPPSTDGWYQTGDLGRMDGDYLTVLGRIDHMFICAGENIQPEEIENVILRLQAVKQVVVVAKDDPEYGHRPIAFVRMHGEFNEGLLKSHCVKLLPGIKVPVAFHPWPEDLTQGLKISRKFFQERLSNFLAR